MTWVLRRPDTEVHKCAWPLRDVHFSFPSMLPGGGDPTEVTVERPDGQEGDLWRCPGCRRLWQIAEGCDSCTWNGHCGRHYAGLILRLVWMPARWWQKILYARR